MTRRFPAFCLPLFALFLPAVCHAAGPTPLDEEETILSRMNCGPGETPAGWKAVGQWTMPGRFPKRSALRAYHAASFGSGEMNVNYMVCHLGWYRSAEDSLFAFGEESRGGGSTPYVETGDHVRLRSTETDASAPRPRQNHYEVVVQRGPFLLLSGISTTETWTRERLDAFGRALEDRLLAQSAALPPSDEPVRLLKEKLMDPSRAPACARKCALHRETFAAILVPMAYGLRMPVASSPERQHQQRQYREAESSLFPNAAPRSIEAGCMVDDLRDSEWTCACRTCTAEAARWRSDQPQGTR